MMKKIAPYTIRTSVSENGKVTYSHDGINTEEAHTGVLHLNPRLRSITTDLANIKGEVI